MLFLSLYDLLFYLQGKEHVAKTNLGFVIISFYLGFGSRARQAK
jgi:hypothetical protein